MTDPNKQQKQLIENTEGTYLVDAGAGTGKTFTITRRYARIVGKKGVEPEDVFLATFTRNAAEEMSERIVELTEFEPGRIFEAPISTFHSHCQKILERHGFNAPELLGIEEKITEEVDVMESQVRERQEFKEFYSGFKAENTEYNDFYRITEASGVLGLLKTLASKGIFPTEDAWFGEAEKYLDGDYERFKDVFKEMNKPRETSNGQRQSELRDRLYSYRWKDFPEDAPDVAEIRGGRGTKSVRQDFMRRSFEENRDQLKSFVHDLYYEYLEHCLSRNYLNFPFIMALSYVLLHERPEIREKESFEYVMIDEFQDTNEIQLKLALLLSEEPNIAAVGDWKQSIYSFQHASVENIQRFQKRLEKYLEELQEAEKTLDIGEVERIELKQNYRSGQKILDFSEHALELPAHRRENVPAPDLVSLESKTGFESSKIERFTSENEPKAVLSRIQEIIDNENYLREEGETLEYGDIAVLTRTRRFGLELQELASTYGIPVEYEGGVELFKTPQALLLLAWLRILNSDSLRGWAVVLEHAGYSLDEAKAILDEENKSYPPDMKAFREKLESFDTVKAVANTVFEHYGYENEVSDRIIEVIQDAFRSTFMNTGSLISFIEDNIEEGEIYQVETRGSENSVTVQTVHAAKGLEYPAVFIADVNKGVFPSQNSGFSVLKYQDPLGLRQRKKFDSEYGFSFDNWRYEILSKCMAGDYDEERRLMYVAMTRAENHLFFSAEEGKESPFYENLDLEEETVEPELRSVEISEEDRETFDIEDS
ncbi:ATP-dependent helicase [Candidatus Nanohalococcus occultus]|uniref:ATP-dependent helicase n=1 Tax=Candidatus Nanohalococcus occultus TaxID=2978047 RepID=UPI0039DFC1FF